MASQLATFHYVIGGSLVDADTVTLAADPALYGTNFGIRRQGDGAIIVAAGAATVHAGQGIYTYDYGALGLDPAHDYLLSFKATKAGQSDQYATTPILASAFGSTLRNIRRELARKLRQFRRGYTGVQVAPPLGAYTAQAAGADAQRQIVTSDLLDTDKAGVGSDVGIDALTNTYFYFPSVPIQRRVAEGGYTDSIVANNAAVSTYTADATTRVARITFRRPFAATLGPGLEWEAHHRLPVTDQDGLEGLHALINRALRSMRITKTVTIPGVTGQFTYDLSAQSWLTRQAQLGGVYSPATVAGALRVALPGRNMLRFDGATPLLDVQTPVPAGQSFTADFYRPASSYIKVGGTWGDSAFGPVNETDECFVELDRVVLVAYYFCCEQLSEADPIGQQALWAQRMERAAQAARPFMSWGQPTLDPAPRDYGDAYADSPAWLARREGGYGGGRRWP